MNTKEEVIRFRLTDKERRQYQLVAERLTEGNISLLIRNAMRDYTSRHMTTDATTEYEVQRENQSH